MLQIYNNTISCPDCCRSCNVMAAPELKAGDDCPSDDCPSHENKPIGIVLAVCKDFDRNGIYSVGSSAALRAMAVHWADHIAQGHDPKIISDDIDELKNQLEIMRAEIMRRLAEATGFNRRPFQVTEDGFLVNGRICFDIAVAESLFDADRQEIEKATNDRFEQFLRQNEGLIGKLNHRKYLALIDSFVEIIVKSCCTTEEAEPC